MNSFQDKVVVITGGARGVGFAAARQFAASGAKVILADILDATAQAEEIGGLYIKTDISTSNFLGLVPVLPDGCNHSSGHQPPFDCTGSGGSRCRCHVWPSHRRLPQDRRQLCANISIYIYLHINWQRGVSFPC